MRSSSASSRARRCRSATTSLRVAEFAGACAGIAGDSRPMTIAKTKKAKPTIVMFACQLNSFFFVNGDHKPL
jgi:hypothetical protein